MELYRIHIIQLPSTKEYCPPHSMPSRKHAQMTRFIGRLRLFYPQYPRKDNLKSNPTVHRYKQIDSKASHNFNIAFLLRTSNSRQPIWVPQSRSPAAPQSLYAPLVGLLECCMHRDNDLRKGLYDRPTKSNDKKNQHKPEPSERVNQHQHLHSQYSLTEFTWPL